MQPTSRPHENATGFDERSYGRLRQGRSLRLVQEKGAPAHTADDRIPLFLADPNGKPIADEFRPPPARSPLKPRFALGGLAAVGATIVAATLYVAMARPSVVDPSKEPTMVLAAALPASSTLTGPDASREGPPATEPAVTPAEPPGATQVIATAAPPNREALIAAYKSALQSQAATASQPPSATSPTSPESSAVKETIRRLSADEVAALLKRGSGLIASGDIAAARLVLVRAAEAGDARAATMVGETYDPAVLARR
jgi:hypothetical protein